MKTITPTELLHLLPDDKTLKLHDPIHTKYLAWTKLSQADQAQLLLIGDFKNPGNPNPYEVYNNQYWQPDAPIALKYYPFNGSAVYQYQQNGGLYFVYTEFSGHAPETRCRLIQPHLIVEI